MSPRPEPRIGDAERDAAMHALGEHYAAGRLTKEEFDERSDLAMRARFDSEMRPLFADLPLLAPPGGARRASTPTAPTPPGRSRQQGRAPGWPWWQHVRPFPLVLGLLVVALVTDAWWLLFVACIVFVCRPRHRHFHH